MLNFIVGTAGTGKTTKLWEKISKCVKQGEKAILLVPEQFSFECEKHLYHKLGPKENLNVEVLSFTRLCNNIFREYGGLSGKTVTPTAQYLLMSVAVSELADSLKTYKKSAQNTDFLKTLLSVCSEFKTAGIKPSRVVEFAENCSNGRLKDKMEDISSLYAAYQGLLDKGYSDPDDDLMRACSFLENNNYFGDFNVFVDGFTAFMAGEFELLGHAIAQARDITFAMTASSPVDKQNGVGVFSVVQQAINRLQKLGEEGGYPKADIVLLEKAMRYKADSLAVLSKEFLQPSPNCVKLTDDGVSIVPAKDIYSEVRNIAIGVSQLVKEKGYRYNEIAVVARDHKQYLAAIETEFNEYEIPFFDDRQVDIENMPLVSGLLAAIEAVRSNFDSEAVIFLAKNPIMGLDMASVAMLENYCYTWSIKGALWSSEFKNHPRGMVEEFTDNDNENLAEINYVRERLISLLSPLKNGLVIGTGKSFANCVYDFLVLSDTATNINAYAQTMPEHIQDVFSEESAAIWDIIIDTLDIFAEILGIVKLGQNRLVELYRVAFSTATIGGIPQTLDQVLVGSADRIRPWGTKVVFVLGANEGVFPPTIGSVGVFSDNERQQLVDFGIGISPAGFYKSLLERFFVYFTITLPSEKLVISYSKADLKGKELLPSLIVNQIQAVLENISETTYLIEDEIQNKNSGFAVLARNYLEDIPLVSSLISYFSENKKSLLAKMKIASSKKEHFLESKNISKKIFGEKMRLSPSRVERYYRCPFSYFAQDGLGLRKRQKVEFSPLESGSIIHHVLQIMLQKHGGKGLGKCKREQLQQEVETIISDYLSSRVEDIENMPTRFKFLFRRLCATLVELLVRLGKEFEQSLYTPVALELPIRQDEGVRPIELITPTGIPIIVEGVVDRVDVMEKGNKKFVRVVDYKSGAKDFSLVDVMYGLNMQMLMYLFTIKEHGTGELGGAIPSGVLYMPVRESYISTQRNESKEKIKLMRDKQWTMSGLLLEDEDSLKGMEKELSGLFIPAKQKKDGSLDARASLASLTELSALEKKVGNQLIQMAENLHMGKIPAMPVNTVDYPTCSYCDYRSVCGYEEGEPIKEISKMDCREIFKALEEEPNE